MKRARLGQCQVREQRESTGLRDTRRIGIARRDEQRAEGAKPDGNPYLGQRKILDGTVRSRVEAMSDGSGRKNVVLSVFPKRISM